MLLRLAPLRRAWVREFLDSAYRRRAASTRASLLRALAAFDAFLVATAIGGGQWSLVTVAMLETYLGEGSRLRLERARIFFHWLHRRKGSTPRLDDVLPRPPHLFRPRVLPVDDARRLYSRWISTDAPPTEALVGLLALVHCLRTGEIRHLRTTDLLPDGQLRVGGSTIVLTPPVIRALDRYLRWRRDWYDGPSEYLIVSRASRLHNRPVASNWFAVYLLPDVSVAALRQTAIQGLIQGTDADGLQLAAYTRLSLDASSVYLRAFGGPAPWPPSAVP